MLVQIFNQNCNDCREDLNQSRNINVNDSLVFVARFNEICNCTQ